MIKEETENFLMKNPQLKSILKKRNPNRQEINNLSKNENILKERFDVNGNKINSKKKLTFNLQKIKIHNVENWSKYNSDYSPQKKCCQNCFIF